MMVWRKRMVRLHQLEPAPSVEGILVGKPWRSAGHYVLRAPRLLESEDRTVSIAVAATQPEAWVPRERVILIEVLS